MSEITTVGIDLAKDRFDLHGVDAQGECRLRRPLRRRQMLAFFAQLPPCLAVMEACASAHYWGRELRKLGHQVKLIPPQYVKPFVRGNKTNRNDAEAICEAGLRPRIPGVAVKDEEQQAVLALHRVRALLESQRKQLSNQLRGLLGEFGIAIPKGVSHLHAALPEAMERVPQLLRPALEQARERLRSLQAQSTQLTGEIERLAKQSALCRRFMQEPGVGPIVASTYAATIGDPSYYRNGRQVSASLGIVPRQHSSGDRPVLLGISKRGDRYLRTQLIHGARAVVARVSGRGDPRSVWLQGVVARGGRNKAAVALANKTARRLWAIWRDEGASFSV
jgi:transposase